MYPTGTTADDRGFTLFELLVAMTLLSLAAVITLAWLPGLEDRMAVDQSAKQIERVLVRAADEARASGSDRIVRFEAKANSPRLILGDRIVALDPTINISWLGAREAGADSERSSVVFLATGGASGGAVELSRGQVRVNIEIDWLTGNVRQMM